MKKLERNDILYAYVNFELREFVVIDSMAAYAWIKEIRADNNSSRFVIREIPSFNASYSKYEFVHPLNWWSAFLNCAQIDIGSDMLYNGRIFYESKEDAISQHEKELENKNESF